MFQLLLRDEQLLTDIQGEKEDVFRQMLGALPEWQLNKKQKQKVLEILLLRESYGTTAAGGGLALPHGIAEQIKEPVAVLGISREGVDFAALDGEKVYLVYLLLVPAGEEAPTLKKKALLYARKIFSDTFLQRRLCQTVDREEAVRILQNVSLMTPSARAAS